MEIDAGDSTDRRHISVGATGSVTTNKNAPSRGAPTRCYLFTPSQPLRCACRATTMPGQPRALDTVAYVDHAQTTPSQPQISSSSRNEYYLGGTIALLLQVHRTMSTTGSL